MLSVYFASRPVSPQNIANKLSQNLNEELQKVDVEAEAFLSNLKQGGSLPLTSKNEYSFYFFDGLQLKSWSNNDFVPSAASVAESFNLKLLKAGNGSYLAKKWKLNDNDFLLAVIPLFRKL